MGMREPPKALGPIGSAGGGGLMWAAEQFRWEWPTWAIVVVAIISGVCLIWTTIMGVEWFWYLFNDRRERHQKKRLTLDASYIVVGLVSGAAVLLVAAAIVFFTTAAGKQPASASSSSPPAASSTSQTPQPLPAQPRTQPYRLTNNSLPANAQIIIRVSDGAFIPPDPRNADFQQYSAWLTAGYAPDRVEATLDRIYAPRSPNEAEREIPIVDKLVDILQNEARPSQDGVGDWQEAFDVEKSGMACTRFG
jgi:hypothetical protein